MDKSSISTPSPSAAHGSNRSNPFSIDYILSSTASKQQQQEEQEHSPDRGSPNEGALLLNQQLSLINQHRAQIMAANNSAQSNSIQQQATSTMPPPIKVGQQTPPQPHFLYMLAYMLLQQEQQRQQQQQHQQQVARHQAAAAANQHHLARQPVDLARGDTDNLAILARLVPSAASAAPSILGKHQSRLISVNSNHSQQSIRHQPYQTHTDRHYQPLTMASSTLHHPLAALNGSPSAMQHQTNVDMMINQQRRLSPLMNFNSLQQGRDSKYGLTSSNSSSSSHQSTSTTLAINNPDACGTSSNLTNNSCNGGISNNNVYHNGSGEKLDNLKPAHSYIGLIGMCILSTPDKRMVLNDIYQFILDNYPYYRNRGSGWRNSVRHNLSLNECFQKAGRAANGKGHYWTIHPANMEDFMLGDFRRRRAQRKVRRWNNMDVPSDESDDESMEDATKPPLPEHFKRSLEMHRRLELSYQKTAEAAAFVAAGAAAAAALNQPNLNHQQATRSPCSPLFHGVAREL